MAPTLGLHLTQPGHERALPLTLQHDLEDWLKFPMMNRLSHLDIQLTNAWQHHASQAAAYMMTSSASHSINFPKLRKLNLHSVTSSEDALHALPARPLRASKSTTPLGCIIFASGCAAPRKTNVSFVGRWPSELPDNHLDRRYWEMPPGNVAASVPTTKILVLQSSGPNLAAVVHLRYITCLQKLYVRMNI
uniref:Uncharacterized protein n=1 Tax=Oryza rufipogon TaxID=4529 RepID=A0A0E0Q6Q9_ORYRU